MSSSISIPEIRSDLTAIAAGRPRYDQFASLVSRVLGIYTTLSHNGYITPGADRGLEAKRTAVEMRHKEMDGLGVSLTDVDDGMDLVRGSNIRTLHFHAHTLLDHEIPSFAKAMLALLPSS